MDRAFDFRAAPVPPWRRLNRRAVALAVTAFVLLSGLALFSRWVVESERRSFHRGEAADAAPIVGTISGGGADADASPVADLPAIDAAARADARSALQAARHAARGRATFLDAGPGRLSSNIDHLVVVDGPALGPGVVSVASTRDAWGAAVFGSSGACYLLRFAPGSGVTYGVGADCTGEEALAARDPSW
ncbi:MAG TPA: hypothetical protein VG993_03995 [Actinomycetota bacterium]|jgi:hypothetical protein|nr:hypothetical protein [Actinomycetota bacterium]